MVGKLYCSPKYFILDARGQGHRLGGTAKAASERIVEIVLARNMGEGPEPRHLMPCKRPPDSEPPADLIETEGFTVEVLHMACFVEFLAFKSGVASIEEVPGERGMALNTDLGEGNPFLASPTEVVRMTRQIDRFPPGYPYG